MKKVHVFPGGQEPGPELPCPVTSYPPIFQCREDIPTLNDKCSKCGVRPICFLEGSDDAIYAVSDKCKECLCGWLIFQEKALDELVAQAQELDMGYGK